MKTIESYLPIFQGFYGTYFAPDCDIQVCEDEGVLYTDIVFDYEDYRKRVGIACISSIENYLKHDGFTIKILFDGIYSPKEYNFTNDSINCTYKVSEKDFKKLVEYLKSNLKEFKEFLEENYSGYSGFVSFYSTDSKKWLNEYLKEDSDSFTNVFSGILRFYLENEGYTVDDMLSETDNEISHIDYALSDKKAS